MKQDETKITFALVTPGGRTVLDFGSSEQSMWEYIDRHREKFGAAPISSPTEIHTTIKHRNATR